MTSDDKNQMSTKSQLKNPQRQKDETCYLILLVKRKKCQELEWWNVCHRKQKVVIVTALLYWEGAVEVEVLTHLCSNAAEVD